MFVDASTPTTLAVRALAWHGFTKVGSFETGVKKKRPLTGRFYADMDDLIYFRTADSKISYLSRSLKDGPEKDLVEGFVLNLRRTLSLNTRFGYSLFIEPKLDVGFPDVVVVKYSRSVMKKWAPSRRQLDLVSLKILSHLFYAGPIPKDRFKSDLGFADPLLTHKLKLLEDAKLVYKKGELYRAYSFRDTFAVREVVAIEAKMSDIFGAMCQASKNKWFATSSYILTPSIKPTTRVASQCEELGIGIYGLKQPDLLQVLPPRPHDLPKSYVTLLLNEWIGRKICDG